MSHKLLLADDSVTIQRVIELTFADEDIQVLLASNGRQAIERIQADRPDVVLADVGMPERDGYEVAAFVKGTPGLDHIPVLLLTGAFEPLDEARAREVGSDGVLVKPFEPQVVINRVKELITRPRTAKTEPAPAPLAAAPASAPAATVDEPAPAPAPELPVGEPPAAASATPAAKPVEVADPAPPRAVEATPSPGPDSGLKETPRTETTATVTKSASGLLDDYFDRLDAAFASLGAPGAKKPAVEQDHEDLRAGVSDPQTPPPRREAHERDPLASWDPDIVGGFTPAQPPPLADAFAALLAAEQGDEAHRPPIVIPPPGPLTLSDEVIDEIVRRVIARMGDESMRKLVLDTAERLVREEIDRIKRTATSARQS